jgi:hypothetical protein
MRPVLVLRRLTMRTLWRVSLLAIIAAMPFSLTSEVAAAASYERCIEDYRNVQSTAYNQRLQQGAAAKAAACPEGWETKYGDDDGAMMADPCYGDPAVCAEPMGLVETRTECGEVSASKLGTEEQVQEAEGIYRELQQSDICHFAQ